MESLLILSLLLLSFFTPTDDHQMQSIPWAIDHDWTAIADSVQWTTFQCFPSDDGQYIDQDNGGNQTFHYWWNAHALDVLVDAHLRNNDQEAMMLTLLRAIRDKNNGEYPNNYNDDMEWLALSSLRVYENS